MEKLLSIIIPAYNVEKFLDKTLDSICKSRFLDKIEILIINDGSTDNTNKIAEQYANKYSESVVLIDKDNGGHGSTINTGIKMSNGKYIKVVDGDDWVDAGELDKLINVLKDEKCDLILCSYNIVEEDGKNVNKISDYTLNEKVDADFCDDYKEIVKIYHMHAVTFRTECLKSSNKLLTENCFYVDQEYLLFHLSNISTYSYYDFDVYQYRIGRDEQSVSYKNMIKRRNMHKKVIEVLLDDMQKSSLCFEKTRFYAIRISDLMKIQYNIYLQMDRNKNTYAELKTFNHMIKSKTNIITSGKKEKILHFFPLSFWVLSR